MKILSLFDGMACGMLAMMDAGVTVESYDAYEIDKYAVKTAEHNFPQIKEHGDVFKADFTEYKGVDFLVGGSPCTYWSIAQTKNRETTASGMGWELFSQYVRALKEAKPRFFIYENNKSMSKDIRASITDTFGFEPICINSALVSAQNRQRLYWCGIRQDDGTYRKADIEQPADMGILLKDVLDGVYSEDLTGNDKSYTMTASYNGAAAWNTIERSQRNMVAERISSLSEGELQYLTRTETNQRFMITTDAEKSRCVVANYCKGVPYNVVSDPVCVASRGRNSDNPSDRTAGIPTEQHFEAHEDGKTNALTTVQKDNMVAQPIMVSTDGAEHIVYEVSDGNITIRGKSYPIKLKDGYYIIRKLAVSECKRLQTVPEWYDFSCVSNTQAYKMLGNGWTVKVISHLIQSILRIKGE